jgi:hypothetical protein
MSKNVKIIASVACLVLAGGIMYFTMFQDSGGGPAGNGKMWIKCVNPKCNASNSFSPEEFSKKQGMAGMNPMLMMMPGQQMAFTCDKCGQKTAYMAQQCQKCNEVFVRGQGADQKYPDKCPKCGFSRIAEYEKSVKSQK